MDDLPKVGEKLVIVGEFGKKLLVNLYNIKQAYATDGQRPIILSDANLQPVYKAILKRFPDTGGLSQVQGASTFDANHKAVLETLGAAYDVLQGVVDFRDGAINVLSDCNRLVNLSSDLNPDLLQLFMRLLLCFIRVNLLVSTFTDRKLVTAAYSRAFFTANGTTEANYQRIAKYLQEYDAPLVKMQEDLFGLSARVGQVLGLMKQNLDRSFPPTESLFNEGPLNTIHVASNIAKPSEESRRLFDLAHPNELTEWILFGFLVCPSELTKVPNIELFKSALQKGFSYEIYRDELINFHSEHDQVLSDFKGNVKQAKNVLSEATNAMVAGSPSLHQDRRNFLRLQLYQTHGLLSDKPAIIVPKLSLILSLLSMAKEEIFWYFRHAERQPPKNSKAKFKDDDNRDFLVTELLYLVLAIKDLVLKQKDAIKKYYVEYLSGFYKSKLVQTLEQVLPTQKFDEKMKAHFDNFVNILGSLGSQPDLDLEPFRLNWIRVQAFFSLPTSSVSPIAAANLINLLVEISCRTRYVDQLESLVESSSSLAALYFEKATFGAAFGYSLKHVAQSRYVQSYILVVKSFLDNVSPYFPREAFILGPKASAFMEQMLGELAKRVSDLIHENALSVRDISLKGLTENAGRTSLKTPGAKGKSKKNPIAEVDPNIPGNESLMRPSFEIKKHHARSLLLKNLAVCLCAEETITVYDATFAPRIFLLEALALRVRSFLTSVVKVELPPNEFHLPPVKRPSVALAEVEAYVYGLLQLDFAVDIGVPSIIRDVLLDQVDLDGARKLTKSAQADAQAMQAKLKAKKSTELSRAFSSSGEASILFIYSKWYIETFLPQVINGTYVYSPIRKGYASRLSSPLKIEKYATLAEFAALLQLLGPNGLKYIEERLMRTISTTVGEIKEMVLLNLETLNAVRDSWNNEARCAELQRKLRNIDGLYEKTIGLGVIFTFRSLLAEALSSVLSQRTSHLFNCIANAHKQYPANTYGVAGYEVIDELANWTGIFENVDVALRKSLEVHCQDRTNDRRTWDLLPYLYGITLPGLTNLDASFFNSNLENNENNASCMGMALNKLTVALMSLVSGSAEKDAIPNYQKAFLEVSSTCLLRLNKERPKELESIVMLLLEFTEQSKFLTMDLFETTLPYSFIRIAYAESFRKRGKRKGAKDEDSF